MIAVTIYQNHSGQYVRIHCIGHAGFAKPGEDIICAAVSVLVINTLNATETDQKSGLIDIRFQHPGSHDAKLLLDTMVLGLQAVQDQYGTDYTLLTFKEV